MQDTGGQRVVGRVVLLALGTANRLFGPLNPIGRTLRKVSASGALASTKRRGDLRPVG